MAMGLDNEPCKSSGYPIQKQLQAVKEKLCWMKMTVTEPFSPNKCSSSAF